jgi:hypothetical protein
MFRKKILVFFLLNAFLIPNFVFGQTKIYVAPKEDIEKIRAEGLGKNSQVMQTLDYLTNVIGGRLTNSPNMKRANEWTRDTMSKWGMQNAKLVAWGPFGRGWSLKRFSAQVTSPQSFPLIAYPKAWSPGISITIPPANPKDKKAMPTTSSVLTADVVYFDATKEEEFEKFKGQLKGKIVLVSDIRELKADFEGMGTRRNEANLLDLANSPDPASVQRPQGNPNQNFQQLQQFATKRANFFLQEGVALIVDNSRAGSGGTVFVQSATVAQDPANPQVRLTPYQKESESRIIPQMTVATEDYNRLVRMIKLGEKPQLTVDLAVQFHDEDLMGYDTVAEIPGTDLKDEVVMLGGHLDSWHSGTGATDNAAGCSVAMEAARILLASGLKPRRTIRVALWSGEEQGLNGSREYVKQVFGEMKGGQNQFGPPDPNAPKPELVKGADYDKLSAYYNLDNGTGKIRGVYLQGNNAVAPIFRQWLMPFKDLGASTLTLQNTGGTDHLSFDRIGLPGFQFIQDEIEYDTRTHHSNQDVYDRIQTDDMKQAATIMAAFVYQTAMMDEKIPRKPMR